MPVLVDTNIWSLSLRRSKAKLSIHETGLSVSLGDLIREDRARLIGPIRQEILSGTRETEQFERVRKYLRAFRDEPLAEADYEHAAQCHNQCRARGISGSGTDFLMCAVALDRGWEIFTADRDFASYAAVLPVRLFPVR